MVENRAMVVLIMWGRFRFRFSEFSRFFPTVRKGGGGLRWCQKKTDSKNAVGKTKKYLKQFRKEKHDVGEK